MNVYKCARKKCDFVTADPFNYCPFCGSIMVLCTDEKEAFPTITLVNQGARCDLAHQCSPMGLHSEACDGKSVRNDCVVALGQMIESLGHELRTLRLAFQEAGLQVNPRRSTDRSVQQGPKKKSDGPG
jgi:hypothetical protein